ncbi:helix-turn-helix domain-containing protein [Paenibacillus sp. GCM10023252]|uniref:helix-turn-helix domain-containing protein n=1 Tax=Paenibacillus sp. GCM10023252 TaxID=3252649 RepID=UPI0036101DDE
MLWKGRYFRRSLIWVLVAACLPAGVISILFYSVGTASIKNDFAETHQMMLANATKRMDDTLTNLELMAAEWMLSPKFDERLRHINLRTSFTETHEIYHALSVIKGSSPLIRQTYLVLPESGDWVVSDGGIAASVSAPSRSFVSELLEREEIVFWQRGPAAAPFTERDEPLLLTMKLPGIGATYGILLIELDHAYMGRMLAELNAGKEGTSLLLLDDGSIIPGIGENREDTMKLMKAFQSRSSETAPASSFEWKQDKGLYTVSSGQFRRLHGDWSYVSAVSVADVISPVQKLSSFVLFTAGVCLLLAAGLSWILSKKLYQPMKRLIGRHQPEDEFAWIEDQWKHLNRESQVLQQRYEQQLPTIKNSFLLQLLQGHLRSFSEEDLRARLEEHGWETTDRQYAFLLFQLHGFYKLNQSGRFTSGDEPLISFAAANIIGELVSQQGWTAEILNFQDLSVGVFLSMSAEGHEGMLKSDIHRLGEEAAATLQTLLKLHATVLISRLHPRLRDFPSLVKETREAARHRHLGEHNQILDMDDVYLKVQVPNEPGGDRDMGDRDLIQALRMGLSEEALRLYERYVDRAEQSGTFDDLQQSLLQLLGRVYVIVEETGFSRESLFGDVNLYTELLAIRDAEELRVWFECQVLAPFLTEYVQAVQGNHKALVDKAIAYLEEHYAQDLSLEACAEACGTYPQKLSTAFKNMAGVNFIDYLTELRLTKAKELLRDTCFKVNEVAAMVGYQPVHFNRVFKKHVGRTPGQYREQSAG